MNWLLLRNVRFVWMLGIASLLLSACANPQLAAQLQSVRNQQIAAALEPGNRLLIQSTDGNLYTMSPDGSDVLALTDNASTSRIYMQPTWSPNSQQIAWTEIDSGSDSTRNALVVSDHKGANRTAFDAPFAPFYMFWSPDGSRLAYLSNWVSLNQPSLALRVLNLDGAEEPIMTLVEGQPLYFSWSPDGGKMLTHIGNERIELHTVDGEKEPLLTTKAQFPAPQWSSTGTEWIYANDADGRQRLVTASSQDGTENELTDFDGRISFTLSPNGHNLAYLVTPENVPSSALGPIYVVDVQTGRTREISAKPAIAFFWSPDGEKLAFLVPEETEDSVRLRWNVWDGTDTQDYGLILPSRTFLQRYLAFFDQYAQSMSIWSPDSTAFTYAGISENNQRGIWVQELGEGKEPEWISRGIFVAWSPQ